MLRAMARGGAVASLLAGVALLATPGSAQAARADADVSVATANGSGCPVATGASAAVLSDDGAFVTVLSPAYYAQAGGASRPTDFRKNCQLSLAVSRPGWTYAVAEVRSSGYAFLAAGTTGVSRTNVYFQGSSLSEWSTHTFTGPQADPWQTVDALPLRFAPCGVQRNLNINTELRVNRGTSSGSTSSFMVRDGETGLRLVWREC